MKTFKQHFNEHHKMGAISKPFNMLEGEVFLNLYDKLYGHDNESRTGKLMKIISQTPAAKIFGDQMSDEIPDELVAHHDMKDVNMLANELLKRIKNFIR